MSLGTCHVPGTLAMLLSSIKTLPTVKELVF